jgi:hypothetical protein
VSLSSVFWKGYRIMTVFELRNNKYFKNLSLLLFDNSPHDVTIVSSSDSASLNTQRNKANFAM